MKLDRCNRVSAHLLVATLRFVPTEEMQIYLQEYASRWGLGFLTFPEDAPPSFGGNPHDGSNSDNDEKNDTSVDESGMGLDTVTQPLPEWFQRLIRKLEEDDEDILLPKNLCPKRRTVKLATRNV